MKKLRILIDIDATISDTLQAWLQRIGDETGVYATVDDITQWALDRCPPLDKVDPKVIFGVLQSPGFIANVPLMPGAAEALEMLQKDGHDIYLVTARTGPVSMPDTYTWLHEKLPFIADKQVIFCYDKWLIPADVLIDDRAETLLEYAKWYPRATTISIQYPYNKAAPPRTSFPRGNLAWGMIYGYIWGLSR